MAVWDGCRPRYLTAGQKEKAVSLRGLRWESDLVAVWDARVGEVGAGFNGGVVEFGIVWWAKGGCDGRGGV